MTKPIFSAEDFEYNAHNFGEIGKFIKLEYAANVANAKLEQLMGPRVYRSTEYAGIFNWHEIQESKDTHQAFVICIEELPKKECKHEPVYELDKFINASTISPGKVGWSFWNEKHWKCAKCGVELKAKWEAVK